MIGASVTILCGLTIGKGAVIGAGSVVRQDVEPGVLASGSPARKLCMAAIVRDKLNPAKKAYPWKDFFERGLPWQGMGYAAWRQQHPDTGFSSNIIETK